MVNLVWIGAVISVIGLAGIIYSIVAIARAKQAKLDDEALKAKLAKVLPINMGALFFSVIGLMTIIVGIAFS